MERDCSNYVHGIALVDSNQDLVRYLTSLPLNAGGRRLKIEK